MKKVLSMLLVCMMMATLFVGCATKADTTEPENNATEATPETAEPAEAPEAAEPVEITFWHAMSGANEEAMLKITDDFMAAYPNVKVTLVQQGGYRDLFDKLMAAAKAEQLPTIAQIYSNRLSWYVSKGLVEDMTPYMQDAENGFTAADYEDIPKMFLDDGIWDGKQYAVPFNKSQMVLYYNVDMLEDAGVAVPTTWEEWTAASAALTADKDGDGEPDVYGTVFENGLSTDIAPWFKQAGGTTINDETGEIMFNTEAAKEAVAFINTMIQNKTARFAGDDKSQNVPLQQGRAAMCVASTSALPYIEKDTMEGITINCAPLPSYKTDDQLFYGTNVTMFNAASEAEKAAAWNYVKFLTNTENTAYFGSQTGYIPVRKSAQEVPVFKAVLEEKPMKKVPFASMDRGFQGARCVGSINALDALGEELDLVFSGQKDIDSALADAQTKGEQAMEAAQNN
ncbi:MAG: ABC transporter substrate-binding protein [Clostridia bacterium]|nr:ABC transporter substrate-binding protein [Clostridia bacterium]